MKRANQLLRLLPAVLALTLSAPASAEVPKPAIPDPLKGEQCVEPVDEIRRNHMEYLKHQRDDTLRRGIRTEKHSLKACLACHVQPAQEAAAPEATSEHFCMNCHQYAGVRIDCFECHATQPQVQGSASDFEPLVQPSRFALGGSHQTNRPN